MDGFASKIVKHRKLIIVISLLLLIPSFFGFVNTKVNYDILSYLPKDIDTMKGQDILTQEFGKGAFAFYIVEGMNNKDVSKLKKDVMKVKGVEDVIWYDSLVDINVPVEALPDKVVKAFNSKDSTMMAIFFKKTTSDEETLDAVKQIRNISKKDCFLSGMSSVVLDIKKVTEHEEYIYVLISVILTSIVLALFMDSFLVPVLFMLSIGLSIAYNLGSNIFLGDVSFITKAIAAVLQLGVTMDYSIFLWHSYKEMELEYSDRLEAMTHAIKNTVVSITGSSLTSIAGFLALCFMSFTLGTNLGIVMAKGVLIGVIACVTVLPSLILVFDKWLDKTAHHSLMPQRFDRFADFITNHYKVFIIIFIIVMIPAIYGYNNTKVYYDLTSTLPKNLESIQANDKLQKDFNLSSSHMVLIHSNIGKKEVKTMSYKIENIKGVKEVLGIDSLLGSAIPEEVVPNNIEKMLKSDNYQLILVNSSYPTASDEVNNQIDRISKVVKNYDNKGMVIGEAACTKDLIEITDQDFKNVSAASIIVIFVIIMLLLKSISLPIVLVSVVEGAIFMNMGVPFYTNTTIPFIASVVIGTIQLGCTIDYAILMTTRFRKERRAGVEKKEAVKIALSTSMPSVIVSALGFFAATFGVGMYSNIDMISSLCSLMARGAIISMLVVLTILPSLFMIFDKLINHKIIKELNKKGVTSND